MRWRVPFSILLVASLLTACVGVVPVPVPTATPTATPIPPTPIPTAVPPTATPTPEPGAAAVPTVAAPAVAPWPELWRRSFQAAGAVVSQYLPEGLQTWHGTFFVVSAQGVLYQIELASGAILWQLPLWPEGARGAAGGRVTIIGDRALVALSDLFMDGPSARAASFRSRLVLLDIPARQLVRDFGTFRNNGFTWLVSGSRVLIQTSPVGSVVVLDVARGETLWQGESAALLAADESTFYVSRSPYVYIHYTDPQYLTRQTVYALDAETGAIRWQAKPEMANHMQQGLIAGDRLILLGDYRDVVAVSVADGQTLWQLDAPLWMYFQTAVDGERFYGALETATAVAAFGLSDGAEVWRAPLEGGVRPGLFTADGLLYYISQDGDDLVMHVLDGATGQPHTTLTLGPMPNTSYYFHLQMVEGRLLAFGPELVAYGPGQPVGALEPVPAVTLAKQALPPLPLYVESTRSGTGNIWRVPSDGTDFANISNSGDDNWDPAPSPDGSLLAFESYRTGHSEIWVMRSDGADPRQLTDTASPTLYNAHPTWSADGQAIAFASNRSGEHQIWVMARDGSAARMLTDTGRNVDPAWSPDGTVIAFISDRLGHDDLWLMDADGGNPRPLLADDRDKSLPVWSPDGTRLAFVRHAAGTDDPWGEIVIVDVATGLQWLAPYTNWRQDRNPAFSPDGTRLAWARQTDDPGKPQVWVARLDAMEPPTVIENAKDPVWAP